MVAFPRLLHGPYPSNPVAMPYIVPPLFYRQLILHIAQHPEGATRVQLAGEMTLPFEGRSLQRLLARLVDAGWIIRVGKARQAKYQLAPGRSIPAWWPEPIRSMGPSSATSPLQYTAEISTASMAAQPPRQPAPPAVAPSAPAATQPAPMAAPTASQVHYQAAFTAAPAPRPTAVAPANKPAPARAPQPAAAPITPPPKPTPPPTRPMTPKEYAAWDETLKELIPPMVKVGMKRHDAWMYADRVAERMRPADAERFHAIVDLELDTLTPETSAAYGITPDAYLAWRRKWV